LDRANSEKDKISNTEEAEVEIYKIFHPKERVTQEAAEEFVKGILMDPKKNEYFPVSRYKINKKFNSDRQDHILTKEDLQIFLHIL